MEQESCSETNITLVSSVSLPWHDTGYVWTPPALISQHYCKQFLLVSASTEASSWVWIRLHTCIDIHVCICTYVYIDIHVCIYRHAYIFNICLYRHTRSRPESNHVKFQMSNHVKLNTNINTSFGQLNSQYEQWIPVTEHNTEDMHLS